MRTFTALAMFALALGGAEAGTTYSATNNTGAVAVNQVSGACPVRPNLTNLIE